MTWRATDPEGNESGKVKYDLVPFVRGRGIDVGCGPVKALPHMIGVDNVRFPTGAPDVVADCRDLTLFGKDSLDFVYSSHLLEHVADPSAVLRGWFDLVKVGGYLVLYLPHADLYPRMGQPGANPDHRSDFLPGDVVALMREIGADWDLVHNETRSEAREYSFFQAYRKLPAGSGCVESWDRQRPEKTAAVVRYGAYGDAIWASSVLSHLKEQGYHVTVYTETAGAEMLKHDPHVDEFIIQPSDMIPSSELLAFWLWESRKYTRWVNLVGAVETRLLPFASDGSFHWPDEVRAKFMNQNYLEAYHDFAGLPYDFRQKYYPTEEEMARARTVKAGLPGPMIVLSPSGSSVSKWYPHVQRFIDGAEVRGWSTFVVGDLRGQEFSAPPGHVVGTSLPIRDALALALVADVVVGVESVTVNASAFEDQLTVCILGHSSHENLTKHWRNTIAVEPTGLACYPCHRIHSSPFFCVSEKETMAAACHAIALPEPILQKIGEYLENRGQAGGVLRATLDARAADVEALAHVVQ